MINTSPLIKLVVTKYLFDLFISTELLGVTHFSSSGFIFKEHTIFYMT